MSKTTTARAQQYMAQPAVDAIVRLLQRPQGASVPQIAKYRDLELHSVRSVLSRIETDGGVPLEREKLRPKSPPDARLRTVYRIGTRGRHRGN